MTFRLKRIHDTVSAEDGYRVLVDRIWPRGMRRVEAAIDEWHREIAPSTELRRWFAHAPERWPEFVRRYHEELDRQSKHVAELAERARHETVTLCYAARDREHNNAVALKAYLDRYGNGRS